MPGGGSLQVGEMRESFMDQVTSELEGMSQEGNLCDRGPEYECTGQAPGKAGVGLAWHLAMKGLGKRREREGKRLLGPESEAEEVHSRLLMGWVYMGWRLMSGLPGPCHFNFL